MTGTVFGVVRDHAMERPDALALSGDGTTWTYRELHDAAERLATGLLDVGAQPSRTFAVVADNHPSTCIAWLAGARCGAVPSLVNPAFRASELSWVLGHLDPLVVLT